MLVRLSTYHTHQMVPIDARLAGCAQSGESKRRQTQSRSDPFEEPTQRYNSRGWHRRPSAQIARFNYFVGAAAGSVMCRLSGYQCWSLTRLDGPRRTQPTVLLNACGTQTSQTMGFKGPLPREKLVLRELIPAAGFLEGDHTGAHCRHDRSFAAHHPSRGVWRWKFRIFRIHCP